MLNTTMRRRPPAKGTRCAVLRGLPWGLAVATALAVPSPSPAAAQIRGGPHGLYQTGILEGQFGVGGRIEVDLPFVFDGFTAIGAFDRFLPDCDGCSQWDASGVVGFVQGPFHAGLGATYQRLGSANEPASTSWTGLLVAGLRFDRLEVFVPFLEVRQELASSDQNQQTVSLGFLVGPSRARPAPRAPAR